MGSRMDQGKKANKDQGLRYRGRGQRDLVYQGQRIRGRSDHGQRVKGGSGWIRSSYVDKGQGWIRERDQRSEVGDQWKGLDQGQEIRSNGKWIRDGADFNDMSFS